MIGALQYCLHRYFCVRFQPEQFPYFFCGLLRRSGNGSKHKQNPVGPLPLFRHPAQELVIILFMIRYIRTQIKNRLRQEILLYKIKVIQNPACSPIAIGKRVDGFKLVMQQGQLYQGICLPIPFVIDKLFQCGHFIPDNILTTGRRIDQFPGYTAAQLGARLVADTCLIVLYGLFNLQ